MSCALSELCPANADRISMVMMSGFGMQPRQISKICAKRYISEISREEKIYYCEQDCYILLLTYENVSVVVKGEKMSFRFHLLGFHSFSKQMHHGLVVRLWHPVEPVLEFTLRSDIQRAAMLSVRRVDVCSLVQQ